MPYANKIKLAGIITLVTICLSTLTVTKGQEFDQLEPGAEFPLAHPKHGWQFWVKVDNDYATCITQTQSGRIRKIFEKFPKSLRVVQTGRVKM